MSDREQQSPTVAMAAVQAGAPRIPLISRWRAWLPTVIAFVAAAGTQAGLETGRASGRETVLAYV